MKLLPWLVTFKIHCQCINRSDRFCLKGISRARVLLFVISRVDESKAWCLGSQDLTGLCAFGENLIFLLAFCSCHWAGSWPQVKTDRNSVHMVFLIYWLYERLENWHFKRKNTDLGAFFSLYIIKNRIISSVVLRVSVWLQRKLKIGNLLGDRRSLHGWVHLMNGAPKEKMYFGSLYPSTLLKSCCVLPNPNILALHDWPLKMFSSKVFTNFQFWVCGFSLRLNLHDFFFF